MKWQQAFFYGGSIGRNGFECQGKIPSLYAATSDSDRGYGLSETLFRWTGDLMVEEEKVVFES